LDNPSFTFGHFTLTSSKVVAASPSSAPYSSDSAYQEYLQRVLSISVPVRKMREPDRRTLVNESWRQRNEGRYQCYLQRCLDSKCCQPLIRWKNLQMLRLIMSLSHHGTFAPKYFASLRTNEGRGKALLEGLTPVIWTTNITDLEHPERVYRRQQNIFIDKLHK